MKKTLIALSLACTLQLNATETQFAPKTLEQIPAALQGLPSEALSQFRNIATQHSSLSLLKRADIRSFTLPLPAAEVEVEVQNTIQHKNGDKTYIGLMQMDNSDYRVIYTLGASGGIADITGPQARFRILTKADQYWVANLSHSKVTNATYNNDLDTVLHGEQIKQLPELKHKAAQSAQSNELVVVDAYLLYTPNIVERYPDGLAETLMNQQVATTNQAFVDSEVNVYLRLVGTDFVEYIMPTDYEALYDLQAALQGSAPSGRGLDNVYQRRDELGADLVAMIRTHELNERGVCGVARFPTQEHDILINISNVGSSGGSHCFDTFTHEVGHNFGAGHQWWNGQSVGYYDFSGALIRTGKFNTIMSSIGTGDINRNYGLNKFSNPDIQCGGTQCGDSVWGNNAETIRLLAPQNAALKPSQSEVEVNPYLASSIDTDGDGVFDDTDAFPFDATETADTDNDGVGDHADMFPNNTNEWADTDLDGVGNNADSDDDNDGTPDSSDALPLDPTETQDNDGDGVGDNADQLDNNPFESLDSDGDNTGNRNDLDDDNDGVNDYADLTDASRSVMYVVNAGTDQIIGFDLANSQSTGVLYQAASGAYTFRSEIRASKTGELYVVDFSDVAVFDRATTTYQIAIDRSAIDSNFPAHLLLDNDNDLLVSHGFGPSSIIRYQQGKLRLDNSDTTDFVLREMVFDSNGDILITVRDEDEVWAYDPTSLEPRFWSNDSRLNKPEHLAVLNNGDVLVSNAGSENILHFNSSGTYQSEFIAAGSGGLGKIGCIELGPDGHLYVCSLETNQILKFNGENGAFIEVVMDAQQGIDQPMSITFAGAVLDDEPFNPNNDSDADGVANINDDFPLDASETLDTDGDGIGNNTDTDDDNDQMPDSFENQYGFDPLDPADASFDSDGDGKTNLEEYQDGTDPTNASSVKKKKGGAIDWLVLFGLGWFVSRKRFLK